MNVMQSCTIELSQMKTRLVMVNSEEENEKNGCWRSRFYGWILQLLITLLLYNSELERVGLSQGRYLACAHAYKVKSINKSG
jgi:hypothetical protein